MKVFEGIRVVELASYLFVPAAGAILADWGADVIKIEHPERPDPQRNLVISDMSVGDEPFTPLMQQTNRGKRSIGLDGSTDDGHELLCRLVARADVFLTNLLPESRRRLRVDVDDVRVMNPSVVYVRGSGYGPLGGDRDMPGFDGTTFWARGGAADNLTPGGADQPTPMRPALGDLPGAATLAGAVAAGLLHRERTGIAPVVDVSLLNVAVWGNSPAIIAAAQRGGPIHKSLREDNPNPASLAYRTADDRFVKLSLFQSDRYFGRLCECLGVPELADEPRFADSAARAANRRECTAALDGIFGRLALCEVEKRLADLGGPWSVVRNTYEVSQDPQVLANGYLTDVDDGTQNVTIAASPWQFGETRYPLSPAPEHGADTDEILLELGLGYDEIIDYKVAGVIL
ncbi:CaiB/BaiF CoA transferase family protein [Mycolicibacterium hodleri]|uniref:CoA transferase n=1 Tax=Mycolicibacterium hodleri TaxID=49897 RepID=A0A502E7N5_9MYCO|nr:CoA transferase [Mycolicibacterium hodleri]TPG32461.1 CoA transferase [Mycolicibacterium hodleri]